MYFISHSSEQKEKIAIPLHLWLTNMHIESWIDKDNIYTGDQIYQKIRTSIHTSDFCIAIIDENFLKKEWPLEEINLFLEKENQKNNVILPIFVDIEKESVYEVIPSLKNRAFEYYSAGNFELIKARIFSHFCHRYITIEDILPNLNNSYFTDFNQKTIEILDTLIRNRYYLSEDFSLAITELYNIGMLILNELDYPKELISMKNYLEYIKKKMFEGNKVSYVTYKSIYFCTLAIISHLENKL